MSRQLELGIFADWRIPSARTTYDLDDWRRDCALMREAGASSVVLGLPLAHLRDPRRSDVLRSAEESWRNQLEPRLMIWLHRRLDAIRYRLPLLRQLTAEAQAAGPVLDLERPWIRGPLDAHEGAQIVADKLDGLDWIATCLSGCEPATRPIAAIAPISIPQTYSIYHPSRPSLRTPAPPGLQRRGWQRWTSAGARRVEPGIALYWLERPGMSAEQVLRGQITAARELGCERVWGWSLKWIRAQVWIVRALRESARGEIS